MTAALRVGALFAGYGGLDLAVEDVLDGTPAWFSEIDAAPARILAHHWPDAPNLGDITLIDWATVPPVDILTGGFPCQDVSGAGLRRGLKPGTRSGLWAHFAAAIDALRPSLVIIENVRGLLSAEAHSVMEPDPWDLGASGGPGRPPLRALGAVLGDLADLGYDARWHGIRAADAGAPHGRFRVFVIARPAPDTDRRRHGSEPDPRGVGRVDRRDAGASRERERTRSIPRDRGPEAAPDAGRLPRDPGRESGPGAAESAGPLDHAGGRDPWGPYTPAIRRWEHTTGREAPPATETGPAGGQRLSPAFVEWMMGLPAGHVTDPRIGLTRAEQLKALGNGVVPQQAALALRTLLAAEIA